MARSKARTLTASAFFAHLTSLRSGLGGRRRAGRRHRRRRRRARAIAVALLDAGVPELRLINRTRERAESLGAGARRSALEGDAVAGARRGARRRRPAWSTRTTQGMRGQAPLELDLAPLPPQCRRVRLRLCAVGNAAAGGGPPPRPDRRRWARHADPSGAGRDSPPGSAASRRSPPALRDFLAQGL